MRLNQFLVYLDRILFLNLNIWNFTYHSLPKEYARFFFLKVMLTHPIRSVRAIKKYQHLLKTEKNILSKYKQSLSIPDEGIFFERIKRQKIRPLVGLGFCLKPYNPEDASSSCPSGRANHDCLYLEKGQTRAICLGCTIYRIARKCLEKSCKVYTMTSAIDIARDFLIPQVNSRRFPSAFLLLCPYSVQAIIPPLLICNVNVFLMAYNSGYCRDYQEWLGADRGKKEKMTALNKASWEKLMHLLSKLESSRPQPRRFIREGNIFNPTI